MAIHDFTSERLFVADDLSAGATLTLIDDKAHYLANVLRAKIGSAVLVFNGRDGEWRAEVVDIKKRSVALSLIAETRPQTRGSGIVYCFAPLKHARLDYMVQKATELGAGVLQPVMTRRTVPDRVNLERMRANVIEAAEQCGVLAVPVVEAPVTLAKLLETWPAERTLVFCDEAGGPKSPLAVLTRHRPTSVGVLIGPEGGFSDDERVLLRAKPFVTPIWLGPRIMRADTAAVAALALVNATLGDWAGPA
ncbi:MAG: 16S rRNA (uracil(1498)-N(3))-methyltransferase [Hyphomicrobium sp.]